MASGDPPLKLRRLVTQQTAWNPADAICTLNVTLDAVIVQTESEGFRADTAHVIVLDDFVPLQCCQELLDHLTAPRHSGPAPPDDKWERATADGPGLPVSWGLKDDAMATLLNGGDLPCLYELHARLCKLFPQFTIVHQPDFGADDDYDDAGADDRSGERDASGYAAGSRGSCRAESGGAAAQEEQPGSVCEAFVANAAVHGDTFLWHVDGDPSDIPDGQWTNTFGRYRNRDMGRPLFVSALLYLNERWEADWAAETLFADSPTGTGVFVQPRRGRLVLMDQDVRHRVNAPSPLAPQPRYSFVEKLIFIPTERCTSRPSIARPEWGRPSALASAANLQRIVAGGGGGAGAGARAHQTGEKSTAGVGAEGRSDNADKKRRASPEGGQDGGVAGGGGDEEPPAGAASAEAKRQRHHDGTIGGGHDDDDE